MPKYDTPNTYAVFTRGKCISHITGDVNKDNVRYTIIPLYTSLIILFFGTRALHPKLPLPPWSEG